MARRWRGNPALLKDLIDALDWLYANKYNENTAMYNNWFHWEGSTPQYLNDTMVLLYEHLSPAQIRNYTNAIEKFSPDPRVDVRGTVEAKGEPLIQKSLVVAVRGVLVKDAAKLELVRSSIGKLFDYVTDGDGFYRDGSYIHHTDVAYNTAYGIDVLTQFPDLLYLLDDSSWEINDPDVANVFNWVYDSYDPLLYRGLAMDMTRGRSISKSATQDHMMGYRAIRGLARLALGASDIDKANIRTMIKTWITQNDLEETIWSGSNLREIILLQAIMSDPSVKLRTQPVLNKKFPNMNRAVHWRPDFAFGISMHSDRIQRYEYMNFENSKGWHTGDGMTYLNNNDLKQFNDDFWPTVDKKRLPGTTVDTMVRGISDGQAPSTKSWAGGTSMDGLYGVSGMDLEGWNSTLTAKKSWFMFDDEIVALGAGISSTDNRTIETIVENR